MKKLFLLSVVFAVVLIFTKICFAENEIQLRGIVTKINGDQITVKDHKGKETVVEGHLKGIKVGDPILIKGQVTKYRASLTEPTSQEIDFLARQCSIGKADVDVIPQLPIEGREKIFLWIDIGECNKFDEYKAVREYLRKYTPPPKESIMPPKGYKDFLTAAETNYINDVNKQILDRILRDFSKGK